MAWGWTGVTGPSTRRNLQSSTFTQSSLHPHSLCKHRVAPSKTPLQRRASTLEHPTTLPSSNTHQNHHTPKHPPNTPRRRSTSVGVASTRSPSPSWSLSHLALSFFGPAAHLSFAAPVTALGLASESTRGHLADRRPALSEPFLSEAFPLVVHLLMILLLPWSSLAAPVVAHCSQPVASAPSRL